MLETIRTNKFVNILVVIISILLACTWYMTRHNLTLYGGVAVGLYWSLFWWLQVVAYSKRHKRTSEATKKASRKELWATLRGSREPLRKQLLAKSQMELVRDVLKLKRSFSLYAMLACIYLCAIDLVFVTYMSNHWFIWVAGGICGLFALIEFINLVYYSLELRNLRSDIWNEFLSECDRRAAASNAAVMEVVAAADRLSRNLHFVEGESVVDIETDVDLSNIEQEDDTE